MARNARASLISRVLRAGTLVFMLPTVLLAQLNSELVVLHSNCAGDPHFHTLNAADLNGSRLQHSLGDHCCGDHAAKPVGGAVEAPNHDCGHDQPPVIIAKGAFVATRAQRAYTVHIPNVGCSAGLDSVACGPTHRYGSGTSTGGDGELSHAPAHGAAVVLLRNHALLL